MAKVSEFFSMDLNNPNWDVLFLFRNWRALELIQTDWTQLPDAPVDSVIWAEYRQQLRDLPSVADFANAELPTRPQ